MGELHDAVGRQGALFALVVLIASGCTPTVPTAPTAPVPSTTGAPVSDAGSAPASPVVPSPSAAAIDPAVGRLVWLVNRSREFGVWTTDLAGGDARTYLADLDGGGTILRDAQLVGEDVAFIREGPAARAELWLVSIGASPRLVLDAVDGFVVRDDGEILAVRDEGTRRAIWRVPTGPDRPIAIAELALPDERPELGPFGFALSPDGRTVAAGWVGGPLEVIGPAPASLDDLGAPLVVADDGRLVAVTGRAGEAYLVDGRRLIDLAPPDSDPIAVPGTGWVAWATIGVDDETSAIEVRDLIGGASETYRAGGLPPNVRELTPTHVILESTAFDPLERIVGVVDRRDGRLALFEPSAPEAP